MSKLDDFVEEDSRLSIEFSSSVSLASTSSSGSRHLQMKEATGRQQKNLYTQGKEVRSLYMSFHCGNISAKKLRKELSNLGIQETQSLARLLNRCDGANLKYSEFLLSLTHIDEEDLEQIHEYRTPIRGNLHEATPFATMQDVLVSNQPSDSNRAPTSDVLTWSTPEKHDAPVSRKKPVAVAFNPTPIPTLEPDAYEAPGDPSDVHPATLTPQERNQLIQAYLSNSITTKEFLAQLKTRCGVDPSDKLSVFTANHDDGRNVRFLDLVKEVSALLAASPAPVVHKQRKVVDQRNASSDIFHMEAAPEVKRVSVPHSKEQDSSMRKQRNLFTWEDSKAEDAVPSRRLGVGAYQGSNDIFDQTPEQPKPVSRVTPKRKAEASSDFLGWNSPGATNAEVVKPGRRVNAHANAGGISSIPWGTMEDLGTNTENPHSHNMSKRRQ